MTASNTVFVINMYEQKGDEERCNNRRVRRERERGER
jgi:hypothetical protein